MPRIHIGLDLEYKAAQLRFVRRDAALDGGARLRPGRVLDEGAKQLLDAKVADRRAEEHRRLVTGAVLLNVKRLARPAHELNLVLKIRRLLPEQLGRSRRIKTLDDPIAADPAARAGLVDVDPVLGQMIDALELTPHADGPGDRRGVNAEHLFNFIQQLDRRTSC